LRKLLFLLAIPFFIFLFIISLVLFDYIYFPLIGYKANAVAEKFLEEQYGEDFVIDENEFSKPLGDDTGTYQIRAHPVANPDLTIRISVTEDMEPIWDDYLEIKWRADLNEQFGSIYKEVYGTAESYSYMVNVSFPESTYSDYSITNTYQDIFVQEHSGISNIVFANVILNSSNDMDYQLDLAYELVQHLKSQELNYFSIEITYYNEKLQHAVTDQDKNLNYYAFSNKFLKDREYVLDFYSDSMDKESIKKLDQLISPTDLKQYLREINF